jgi:hypothetical protein
MNAAEHADLLVRAARATTWERDEARWRWLVRSLARRGGPHGAAVLAVLGVRAVAAGHPALLVFDGAGREIPMEDMPPADAFVVRLLAALSAGDRASAVLATAGFVGGSPPFEYLEEAARTLAVLAAEGEQR